MNFAPVAPNSEDVVVIPDGYQQAVVISWGDPVVPGAPVSTSTKQTAAAQRGQFGFNNDFAGLLPIDGQADRFLLVTNHEYTTEQFMFPGYDAEPPPASSSTSRSPRIGMSVVEVKRTPEGLKPVMGRYNRRITADTPITLTGPGARAPTSSRRRRSRPAAPVAGTFANCAGA